MKVKLPPRTNNGKKTRKEEFRIIKNFFAGSIIVTIGENREKQRFIDLKILIS